MNPDGEEGKRARIQRRDTRSFGVSGTMTFDSVNDLWRESDEMFSGDGVVEVDLQEVTHTDSAGLALLVEWLREAGRRGGRVRYLNLPSQMVALADAANLQPVLTGNRGSART